MNIKKFMRCSPLLLVLLVAAGSASAQAKNSVQAPRFEVAYPKPMPCMTRAS